MNRAVLLLVASCGMQPIYACHVGPGPGPLPPGPDSGDGAVPPQPASDAAPPATTCDLACNALDQAGCSLGPHAQCVAFLQRVTGTGKDPNAVNHKPLTCNDVAQVKTKADAVALGFGCKP